MTTAPEIIASRCLLPQDKQNKMTHPCLPKAELQDGQWYKGHCRNSDIAKWNAAKQRFEYIRRKFDMTFKEEICHPEDDKDFDVFYPAKTITESEAQIMIEAKKRLNV